MTHVIVTPVLLIPGSGAARPPHAAASATAETAIALIASCRFIATFDVDPTRFDRSVQVAAPTHFVYHADVAVSRIAAAIGEPARARMLYCLADGRARTSTELAVVGRVSPSTAS